MNVLSTRDVVHELTENVDGDYTLGPSLPAVIDDLDVPIRLRVLGDERLQLGLESNLFQPAGEQP